MDSRHKLNLDERDSLAELIAHPGYKVLLKEMGTALEAIQSDVLKYDLGNGDEKKLIRLKCRAEGAASFLDVVQRRLENLKAKQKAKP